MIEVTFNVDGINEIFEHFGEKRQLEKLYEEAFELKLAKSRENLVEEIADVFLVALQLYSNLKQEERVHFQNSYKYKMSRTKMRIKENYYEKQEKEHEELMKRIEERNSEDVK